MADEQRHLRKEESRRLSALKEKLTNTGLESSFYRYLTHDDCLSRHNIIEPEMLEKSCPLDNGRHDDLRPSPGSMGLLRLLPRELLEDILLDKLSLYELTKLRSVSRGLRSTIDSSSQYGALIQHAPTAIRAALSLEVAASITCHGLYQRLCSPSCLSCGNFGAFLTSCRLHAYALRVSKQETSTVP
jgi:hypothetical protein